VKLNYYKEFIFLVVYEPVKQVDANKCDFFTENTLLSEKSLLSLQPQSNVDRSFDFWNRIYSYGCSTDDVVSIDFTQSSRLDIYRQEGRMTNLFS
jgi:hypothetical protein